MKEKSRAWFYQQYGKTKKIDDLIALYNQVEYHDNDLLTDFLDPGQIHILREIIGNEFFIDDFGGYPDAEKRRVYISERDSEIKPEDFQITAFEVEYANKFIQLRHSDILGSLANSGIELGTFGDIIHDESGRWQFFAKTELRPFFLEQIDRIGRNKVRIREVAGKEIIIPEDTSIEKDEIVSSLRLDSILAGISRLSRTKIKDVIEQGDVKLNWLETRNSNIIIKVDDIISLRHFGRIKVVEITTTRKGKFKVVLKHWQAKKRHN